MSTETRESTDGGQQLLLGKMLLERGLISPDQLREALADRARSMSNGSAKPLGIILVAKGFLTDSQLVGLLAEQSNRPPSSSSGSIPGLSLPPPPAPPVSSATRLGKYELVNELGRGGMGVVYEALDTQLNRKVALKLMLTNPSADAKDVSLDEERFVQEAQLSAKLKHPNIVTVYEAGILEGRRFLAMEMIEGQAFSDWRKETSPGLKTQIELIRDVALAVHHAHEQGILHRDLKPRNVLVGSGNRAYVTDFGLAKSLGTAKAAHSLTGSGAVVGTPAYMSPEQAQGNERVDWRTDIWSLGVMLYESLTGRTPFTGESPIEILMKVVKDPVPPPSTVVEGGAALALDRAIENICLKALAKRDRDRYVTARAFAEDLTRWLNGEQIKVHAPKAKKGSRPRVLIVGAAVAALLVAGALLVFLKSRPSVEGDLVQARRFMELENYIEAASIYTGVLKVDPKNAEAADGRRRALEMDADRKKKDEERIRQQLAANRKEGDDARRKAEEEARKLEEAKTEEDRQAAARAKAEAEERARLADEAARKLDEKLRIRVATKEKPVDPAAPEDPWRYAVNLLPLAEFPKSNVRGTWTVQGEWLISERESYARIEIPYTPAEEYDAKLVFSRLSGAGEVCAILPLKGGKSFTVELGGWKNTSNGFQAYRGVRSPDHAAAALSPCALENDRRHELVVQVRKDGVRAKLNDRDLLSGKVELKDLSLDPCWSLRTAGVFGLGTNESRVVIQMLKVLPVTGKGVKSSLDGFPLFPSTTASPATFKPGLVGTYFHGTNFEVPSFAQVDAAPAFSWGLDPAWKGGPKDAFSVRWSGYLQIPKGGKFSFRLSSDDGARLYLDDVQVISNWKVNAESARTPFFAFEEGYHKIEVEYFEETHQSSIALEWTDSAEAEPVPVPPRLFFHDAPAFKPLPYVRYPELLATFPGHTNYVTGASFSPDGKVFVTVSEDRKVKLWSLAKRGEIFSMPGHTQGILCTGFSPDGKLLASGGWDRRLRFWEAATGTELKGMEGHTGFVAALAFSPDGKRLASAGADRTVRLWDVATRKPLKTLTGHSDSVEGLAFSPDGKLLASSSLDRTVRLWDVTEGREVRVLSGHAGHVQGIAFSPDGATLASAGWDGLIKLWDPSTGRDRMTLPGHTSEALTVAFSPDGKLLVSGGGDCMVRLWDAATGKELRVLPGHTARVTSVVFAWDGRLLLSTGYDMTPRLWDLKAW